MIYEQSIHLPSLQIATDIEICYSIDGNGLIEALAFCSKSFNTERFVFTMSRHDRESSTDASPEQVLEHR